MAPRFAFMCRHYRPTLAASQQKWEPPRAAQRQHDVRYACHMEVNLKTLLVVLFLALLPVLMGATPAPPQGEVVLTARDVVSAIDIEQAIKVATNYGTRPGLVTLDARDGPFTYDHPDKSINIFYSDVTLRSLNGATFTNCVDGVYFDDFPLHDVAIRGITFHCTSGGIAISMARNECRRVMIQDNTLDVQGGGVTVTRGRDVAIIKNVMRGADPVVLFRSTGVRILGNDLRGNVAVRLDGSDGNQITGNRIEARESGVVLREGSDDNKVDGNRISGVQLAGIVLQRDSSTNKVHGNKVRCASGTTCLAVDASPAAWEANQISGNKITR
jgi:parallel beta-helix repeat protein